MSINKGIVIYVVIIAAFFGIAVAVHAGWVIVERKGDTALVSNGRVRASSENMVSLIDGAKSEITFINDKDKTYFKGTVDDFCNAMSEMLEMMMKGLPPEQRKMMEQMMEEKAQKPFPEVKAIKEGGGGTIAGFKTTKYKVMVNGELYEEIWFATDPSLMKEIKPLVPVLRKFSKCSGEMAMERGPETSPEYLKLMEKGWEVKKLSHGEGVPRTLNDVVKLEKKNIPDSEFTIPSGYRKVSFIEMMASQMKSH